MTTNLGCTRDTTIYCAVEVYPNPIADFVLTNYRLSNLNSTTTLIDQSYIPNYWQWDFGDGGNSNNQNVEHTYADTGKYTITLAVETNNGCKDTTELTVRVDFKTILYTPNSFSPNGDGLNDIFLPKGQGLSEDQYLLTIFNRWGNIIYRSANPADGWDGTLTNGVKAEVGVYLYRIDYLPFGHVKPSMINGPITLIR